MEFGHVKVALSQIFLESRHSFACVNLKPVVRGHCLVVSKRKAAFLSQLSETELSDLWLVAQRVSVMLKKKHETDSVTFAVQVRSCDDVCDRESY